MSKLCQLCEDNHPALYNCHNCDEDMCEAIKVAHLKSKLSKNHSVIPISDEGSSSFSSPLPLPPYKTTILSGIEGSEITCPIHHDTYRYYDELCQCRICRDCFALKHYGHRCQSIEEGMISKKNQFTTLYQLHLQKQEEYLTILKQNDQIKQQLEESCLEIHQIIELNFQKITDALNTRKLAILEEVDGLYQKFSSNYSTNRDHAQLIMMELQNLLEEGKLALDFDLTISTESAAVKELEVKQTKRLFSLFEKLTIKESTTARKRNDSTKSLEEWNSQAKISFVLHSPEINQIVESINKLGLVIAGEASAALSIAEGKGLHTYDNKDSTITLTAYFAEGVRKENGGDTVTLQLGEKDDKGTILTEFERTIQATIQDKNNGIYEISYRTIANGLVGKIPLHLRLNGQDVQHSPFSVTFNPSLVPGSFKLLPGYLFEISSDGRKGTATGTAGQVGAWCQINPIPLNQTISFRVLTTWFSLYIWETEESMEGKSIGSGNIGKYTWNHANGAFSENGAIKMTHRTASITDPVKLLLTSDGLQCYSKDVLFHTFKMENRPHKLVIATYFLDTEVELLS